MTADMLDDRRCEHCHKPQTDDNPFLDCLSMPGPDVHVGCHPQVCQSAQCAANNGLGED